MHFNTTKIRDDIILIRLKSFNFQIKKLTDEFKSYISNESCQNVILDLTGLNLLDCIRLGSLAATYHFTQFLNGKIYLVVDTHEAQRSIKTLGLDNTVVIYNCDRQTLENIA